MHDPLGAFVPGPFVERPPLGEGPLSGLTFAVKDLFDVAGRVTGCGNPDWAASHAPAEADAWAVATLREAGAALRGITITDEISLGLLGINRHHGTPLNPRAPDRVPGGSSSGSASAVAGGLVDVALGTDSGGSVRVPSSFCGLLGLRPTHGRIAVAGLMTQAPSFDTVGYFAREAGVFGRVGAVLLGEPIPDAPPADLLVATDCFAVAEAPVRAALDPVVERLRALVPTTDAPLAEGDLLAWAHHQRLLQQSEFHATFRDWIDRVNPRFSSEVAGAFASDGRLAPDDLAAAQAFRLAATARLEALLDRRRMLCLPTTPILPIPRDARLSSVRAAVHRIVDLTGIAGLAGLPQVSLPLGFAGTIPVGLSLIGWRGGDAALVGAACALTRRLAAPASGGTAMTEVRDTRTLTLQGALKVLDAAVAAAAAMAQPMCVAVVDTGGNLLAFGRMDGSKGLSVTSSINKARTAALSGEPTGGAHADVEIQVTLAHESRWTNLVGGLPIRVDGFILGAVAAGSGTGTQDLAVARAGAAAIHGADPFALFRPMGAEDTGIIRGMPQPA